MKETGRGGLNIRNAMVIYDQWPYMTMPGILEVVVAALFEEYESANPISTRIFEYFLSDLSAALTVIVIPAAGKYPHAAEINCPGSITRGFLHRHRHKSLSWRLCGMRHSSTTNQWLSV